MTGRHTPAATGAIPVAQIPFPWAAVQEVNENCLEVLARLARDPRSPGLLPIFLRDRLRDSTPETRRRAAGRGHLLVDFQFSNLTWWDAAGRIARLASRKPDSQGVIPKTAAVPLARALLMTARESVRADPDVA